MIYNLRKQEQRVSVHFEIGGLYNLRAKNAEFVTDEETGTLVLDLSPNFSMPRDMNERIDADELNDDPSRVTQLLFQDAAMLREMHRVFVRHPELELRAQLILRERVRATYSVDRPTEEVDWLAVAPVP